MGNIEEMEREKEELNKTIQNLEMKLYDLGKEYENLGIKICLTC